MTQFLSFKACTVKEPSLLPMKVVRAAVKVLRDCKVNDSIEVEVKEESGQDEEGKGTGGGKVKLNVLISKIKEELGIEANTAMHSVIRKALDDLGLEDACAGFTSMKEKANRIAEELGMDERS